MPIYRQMWAASRNGKIRTTCEDGPRVLSIPEAGEIPVDLDAVLELLLKQVVLVQEHYMRASSRKSPPLNPVCAAQSERETYRR